MLFPLGRFLQSPNGSKTKQVKRDWVFVKTATVVAGLLPISLAIFASGVKGKALEQLDVTRGSATQETAYQ